MKSNKIKITYFITVMILIAILSNLNYGVNGISLIITFITFGLFVGITGMYLFGKDMKLHKSLFFISYLLMIGITFVPVLGITIVDGNTLYGFPGNLITHYSAGGVLVEPGGFFINFLLLYVLLTVITKLYKKLSKTETTLNHTSN